MRRTGGDFVLSCGPCATSTAIAGGGLASGTFAEPPASPRQVDAASVWRAASGASQPRHSRASALASGSNGTERQIVIADYRFALIRSGLPAIARTIVRPATGDMLSSAI